MTRGRKQQLGFAIAGFVGIFVLIFGILDFGELKEDLSYSPSQKETENKSSVVYVEENNTKNKPADLILESDFKEEGLGISDSVELFLVSSEESSFILYSSDQPTPLTKSFTYPESATRGSGGGGSYSTEGGSFASNSPSASASQNISISGENTVNLSTGSSNSASNTIQLDENQINPETPSPNNTVTISQPTSEDSVLLSVISINDIALSEGNFDTTGFEFILKRSGDITGTSLVNFETMDGTALAFDLDYIPKSGTIQFDPLETEKTLTIIVNGDIFLEQDENFYVVLSICGGCIIAEDTGIGTIINDDEINSIACEQDCPVAGELLQLNYFGLVITGLTQNGVWILLVLAGLSGSGIYLKRFL